MLFKFRNHECKQGQQDSRNGDSPAKPEISSINSINLLTKPASISSMALRVFSNYQFLKARISQDLTE